LTAGAATGRLREVGVAPNRLLRAIQ